MVKAKPKTKTSAAEVTTSPLRPNNSKKARRTKQQEKAPRPKTVQISIKSPLPEFKGLDINRITIEKSSEITWKEFLTDLEIPIDGSKHMIRTSKLTSFIEDKMCKNLCLYAYSNRQVTASIIRVEERAVVENESDEEEDENNQNMATLPSQTSISIGQKIENLALSESINDEEVLEEKHPDNDNTGPEAIGNNSDLECEGSDEEEGIEVDDEEDDDHTSDDDDQKIQKLEKSMAQENETATEPEVMMGDIEMATAHLKKFKNLRVDYNYTPMPINKRMSCGDNVNGENQNNQNHKVLPFVLRRSFSSTPTSSPLLGERSKESSATMDQHNDTLKTEVPFQSPMVALNLKTNLRTAHGDELADGLFRNKRQKRMITQNLESSQEDDDDCDEEDSELSNLLKDQVINNFRKMPVKDFLKMKEELMAMHGENRKYKWSRHAPMASCAVLSAFRM